MDIGFELEEVQVSPGSFDRIMHASTWFAALSQGNLRPDSKSMWTSSCLPSALKSIKMMYQGSSRFNANLKRASCDMDTAYFLVEVTIKVYPATHRE
jgi:hypothetical protein